MAAFKKELRIAHCESVELGCREAFHARAKAAMDVVLETCAWMIVREVHLAAGNEKAAMDELRNAICEVAGEVGPVVRRAVFAQPARDKHLWISVGQGEFQVGVGLVVTQQDIEAGMALFDEIVFQCQRFMLVGYEDVIEVHGLAHQGAGFGIRLGASSRYQRTRARRLFAFPT